MVCKSLNSGKGITPKLWGPLMWRILHCISWEWERRRLSHTMKERTQWAMYYVSFFTSLTCILPCKQCCTNYSNIIKKNRPTVNKFIQRNGLPHWVYEVHKESRQKHRKSSPSFAVISKRFKASSCNNIWNKDAWHAILLVVATFPLRKPSVRIFESYLTFFTLLAHFAPSSIQNNINTIAESMRFFGQHHTTRKQLVVISMRVLKDWNLQYDGTADSVISRLPKWRCVVKYRGVVPDYQTLCMYLDNLSTCSR